MLYLFSLVASFSLSVMPLGDRKFLPRCGFSKLASAFCSPLTGSWDVDFPTYILTSFCLSSAFLIFLPDLLLTSVLYENYCIICKIRFLGF